MHFILDEIVMAGMVLETSLKEIVRSVNATKNYEKATKANIKGQVTQLRGRG